MNILERFSIKQQLILGFSVMVVLFVMTVLTTISQLHKTAELSDNIAELRAPTAFSTAVMRKGVVHALAALRAWIILEDDQFKEEREEAWHMEIEPSLQQLQQLSANWTVPENVTRLAEIEQLLPKFKQYQQIIEEISHAVENKPATRILIEELVPQAAVMTEQLLNIIAVEENKASSYESKASSLQLAQLNTTLAFALADLTEFLLKADERILRSYQQHWANNQLAYDAFSQNISDFNFEKKTIFTDFTAMREKFNQQALNVIEIRQQADWNLAIYWLATKAAPVGEQIERILKTMQSNQQGLLVDDNVLLHKALTNQIRLSWVLLVIAGLASILFAFVLRFMLRLLADLNSAVTTLSKGEDISASASASATLIRTDEFGQIARSIANLNDYLVETGDHAQQVSTGHYDIKVLVRSKNDVLGKAMDLMRKNLLALDSTNQQAVWLQKGRTLVTDGLSGEQRVEKMANKVLAILCHYVDAHIGSLYQWQEQDDGQAAFHQVASYAYDDGARVKTSYRLGEGLIGQIALEDRILNLTDVPDDYIQIQSSLGQITPNNVVFIPFAYRGQTLGVIELGFIDNISATGLQLFELIREPLGIAFESSDSRARIEQGLVEAKTLALKISRNEARTRTIIQSSISGIITITERGLIQSFNAAAETLFSYDEQEVMNKNVKMLMPGDRAREHDGYLRNFLQTGDAKVIGSGREVVALRKDGTEFHMHLSVAEMKIDGDIFFLGTVTDISEQVIARQRIVEANEALQASSEELQSQQEELRVINEELVLKGQALEETRKQTELKAEQLAEASRYKSEFLANMSHELRTPLNSLLILSGSLAENDDDNLSDDEVESAKVVQESGKHLLNLINEILDLSKVEAGKMTVENRTINLSILATALNSRFNHMAETKKIGFSINLADNLPTEFESDETKLNQILSNLISNAIKFTASGEVKLEIKRVQAENQGTDIMLAFSVVDTGIGIAQDQLTSVFEAFQQADGSTSREYGGTGLGLSIAKTFSELLQGRLELDSKIGKGSTFTLYLPLSVVENKEHQNITLPPMPVADTIPYQVKDTPPPFTDDRDDIDTSKPLFLIVEDDEKFARILFDTCHQQQAQAIVAPDAETGLGLIQKHAITGIILDYILPGMNGQQFVSILHSELAQRNIPVHIISATDELVDLHDIGVIGHLAKPVAKAGIVAVLEQLKAVQTDKEIHLLVVEDDKANVLALRKLFKKEPVKLSCVGTGKRAISLLKKQRFTAMIMDLGLPDMTGFELLEILANDAQYHLPPVIVHTGKELSDAEHLELQKVTETIVIKSVSSPERLQDEVHLFINTVNHTSEPDSGTMVEVDSTKLAGKEVLLVDDDMRNTFALAKVLRKKELIVHIAPSGKEALASLDKYSEIDIVLMDIMMPEMDGYETMGHIRDQEQHSELPIIALTAKAMMGDKEKCLEAGANDYLTKPVDVQKLLIMMQMWL